MLVDEDTYLLEILPYIHRNPLKAEIVKSLEDYACSRHKGYLSWSKKWPLLQQGSFTF